MRLSKRLAAGALAAAMALSMLTACGGANSGSNGGQNDTNKDPSSISQDKENNTETCPDDKKDTDTTPPKQDVQTETRAEKFFSGRNIINGPRWTYTVQITDSNVPGDWTYVVASDGNRTSSTRVKGNSYVETKLYDTKAQKEYSIFPNAETVNVRDKSANEREYGYLGHDVWYGKSNGTAHLRGANGYEQGTYEVDGVIYYSDTYLRKYVEGDELDIYCFDVGDTEGRYLRYLVKLMKNGDRTIQTVVYKVTNISNTFDEELLQIPEGYEIKTYENNQLVSTGKKTEKDNYPN